MIRAKIFNPGSLHNVIEPVLACKANSVGAFLDVSRAESDLSTYVIIHVALATQLEIVMANHGLGVDGYIMLMRKEMTRTLASIKC